MVTIGKVLPIGISAGVCKGVCSISPRCLSVSALPASRIQRSARAVKAHGIGKDAVTGWLDLAAIVSSGGGGTKTPYDDFAYEIGRDVYVDLSGWHLYLRDLSITKGLKMHQGLAQQLGQQIAAEGVKGLDVTATLKKIPISLGGGKQTVPLFDLLPSAAVRDLERLCEDYARNV